jgi:hypothetical protein
MDTLIDRMIRAARLDANLYEEVEADPNTMGQATMVVILASVAAGIGHLATNGAGGILVLTLGTLLGWYVWAFLTYFIGTRFLPEPQTKADLGELLRTVGFASSPGLIRVLGIIDPLRGVVFLGATIWMLVAMIVAVRQALDYTSTGRAIGVCVIGWLIQALILALLFVALGGSPGVPM